MSSSYNNTTASIKQRATHRGQMDRSSGRLQKQGRLERADRADRNREGRVGDTPVRVS